jgi:large subunit ribosomal protein L13
MSTNAVSAKSIQRNWHLIDAKTQTLGRLAVGVANILMGKNKVNYVPYLDMGDYVVVTNVSQIKVSGRKAEQKKYYSHSGYPGGLRTQTFAELSKTNPEEIIKHAIKGMLPNNKLRPKMLKKLFIFADSNHPYKKQLKLEETAAPVVSEEVTNG